MSNWLKNTKLKKTKWNLNPVVVHILFQGFIRPLLKLQCTKLEGHTSLEGACVSENQTLTKCQIISHKAHYSVHHFCML